MKIAVYCSSCEGLDNSYVEMAAQLGQWLGRNRHTLVYGGVKAGLMHVVAQNAHDCGARVVGVNIEAFRHRVDSEVVDETIVTRDLSERKSRMIELSDAFVVLPGGLGTIDEWIATLSQLVVNGDTRRGVIIANVNGMYDAQLAQLRQMAASPFARGKHIMELCLEAKNTSEMIELLTNYGKCYEK
ncbi:MAG: TIGR00730 family Rossman fold protein [Muribaculaceae bacterium]|nr:TIGR00730 family Rossman fold protein [Muribaculaceae bacterium]